MVEPGLVGVRVGVVVVVHLGGLGGTEEVEDRPQGLQDRGGRRAEGRGRGGLGHNPEQRRDLVEG